MIHRILPDLIMLLLRLHPRRHTLTQLLRTSSSSKLVLLSELSRLARFGLHVLLCSGVDGESAEEGGEVRREGYVGGDVRGETTEEGVGGALEEEGDEVGVEDRLHEGDDL